MLKVHLFGKFCVEGPSGEDLTPRGSKSQAVIALLATGRNYARTRAWLQDKLWSDRQRAQGAASLRQALVEIRAGLGPFVSVLQADRKEIRLDPGMIRAEIPEQGEAHPGEFLEGLDIRDDEFNDWLRMERARYEPGGREMRAVSAPKAGALPARRCLIIETSAGLRGMEAYFATAFGDTVATALRETIELDLLEMPPKGAHDFLVLSTNMTLDGKRAGLRISLGQGAQRSKIWSDSRLVPLRGAVPVEDDEVLRMVNETTERILMALDRSAGDTARDFSLEFLLRRAIQKLFSMVPEEQLEADNLLSAGFSMSGRGVFLAWRVMLRLIMLVEQHANLPPDYEDEARAFSMQALELDPGNSLVLTAASNAQLFLLGDIVAAEEYARRAIALNPANPFAWDCLSMVSLYQGDRDAAHRLQRRARFIAGSSPQAHWFDMGCCLTATLKGQYTSALDFAHRSASVAPGFHPPLRYLIALYAHAGDFEKASRIAGQLRKIEGDFSIDRMVNDAAYPVSALRQSQLLGRDLVSGLT